MKSPVWLYLYIAFVIGGLIAVGGFWAALLAIAFWAVTYLGGVAIIEKLMGKW